MGRGQSRDLYEGAAGRTRRETVSARCRCGAMHAFAIVRGIDAVADPELARAALDGDPTRGPNALVCPDGGDPFVVDAAVVYHDPGNAVFVLVLPEGARHRELGERAALLAELAADPAHPVPGYVLDFAVAYGAAGLRATLEAAAERRIARARFERKRPVTDSRPIAEARPVTEREAAPQTDFHEPITDRVSALPEVGQGRAGFRRPSSEPIHSAQDASASGVIGDGDDAAPPPQLRSEESLIADLADGARRVEAAVELGQRGHASAIDAVFTAIASMTRTEASAALASAIGFGAAATPQLLDGLSSRKAYVRQGCALGLAVVGGDAVAGALAEHLVTEPTEIWREVARALGEVGAAAVTPLVTQAGRADDDRRERIAWALAHVSAHGGRGAIEGLAAGPDPLAAGAARHALELASLAASDRAQVNGSAPAREVTVNRAFSRRFFEAMNAPSGEVAPARSAPAYVLGDADLLDADDELALPLDESDLLPS